MCVKCLECRPKNWICGNIQRQRHKQHDVYGKTEHSAQFRQSVSAAELHVIVWHFILSRYCWRTINWQIGVRDLRLDLHYHDLRVRPRQSGRQVYETRQWRHEILWVRSPAVLILLTFLGVFVAAVVSSNMEATMRAFLHDARAYNG